jgi:AcrR family transcriptional regulator
VAISVRDQRLRPRKSPVQPRGRETRTRILDAARDVFASNGYAAGTTNHIAGRAGLSVGSLYQYFPNKDAILVELVNAHIDEGTSRLLAAVDDILGRHAPQLPPLADLVDTAVGNMIEIHSSDRSLHRVLFEEAPRPPELVEHLHALETTLVERVAALFVQHPEVHVPDEHLAARMTVDTIESLVHRVVTDEASGIADEDFRRELVRLVCGYLRGGTR